MSRRPTLSFRALTEPSRRTRASCSPSAGASSRSCARPASIRSRTTFPGRTRDRGGARALRGADRRARRSTDTRSPGRPRERAARPRQGRVPRPRRPLRPDPAARARGRAGRLLRAARRPRPRRPDRRRGRADAHAPRRAVAAGRRLELLAKSLRPPPDKYHGLTDVETALPPARARPARQRGVARAVRPAHAA